MKNFIQELSDKEILSSNDILKLKSYIAVKYKDGSSSDRAKILANAVHRVIDSNLPEISGAYRVSIRQKLMGKTIYGLDKKISMYDIYDACLSTEIRTKDYVDSLVSWVNNNVDSDITYNDIYQNGKMSESNQSEEVSISSDVILIEESDKPIESRNKNTMRFNYKYVVCIAGIIFVIISNIFLLNIPHYIDKSSKDKKTNPYLADYLKTRNNHGSKFSDSIPPYFKFKNVNGRVLKKYLLSKKSLLGNEPYFSTIISVAKKYNINPLVLFAIAGQEQGFVPKFGKASRSMANNPFNVYHSWKEYNTSIGDATKIVCATILNLSKNRPSNIEPFTWINRKYAEDKNWAHGVNLIYSRLEKINNRSLRYD